MTIPVQSSALFMAEALFERFPGHRVEVLGGEVSVEPAPDMPAEGGGYRQRVVSRPGQVFTLPGTAVTLDVGGLLS
ncbi:hypothetical protein [Kitasatospora sp. NPDC097691]|uniref:hypothetical protein n=1 Tax=Kitasatospora sp. NPDC097691 TaxID=3157231 RepID=UPI00332D3B0B